jgi:Phospholipase_D-nuclease N-terminal
VNATTTDWLPILVLVAALIFWGSCLLDLMRTNEHEVRTFSKPVWLVILVFGSVLGGLLWLSTGRPEDRRRR